MFFNFNNGYQHSWKKDYCAFAQTSKRKSKEITITLTISPSLGFSDRRELKWKKTWRENGLHDEQITHSDNTPLPKRSKKEYMLRSSRLEYVPAIKSSHYFSKLLAQIHDMLVTTTEKQIRDAAQNFTTSINAHTKSIVDDILADLSISSSIELPADLRDLFSRLQFSSVQNGSRMSLEQRGDGIKARHIPIILSWLAKQAETLSAKGKPKPTTFWAYESPKTVWKYQAAWRLPKRWSKTVPRCKHLSQHILQLSIRSPRIQHLKKYPFSASKRFQERVKLHPI